MQRPRANSPMDLHAVDQFRENPDAEEQQALHAETVGDRGDLGLPQQPVGQFEQIDAAVAAAVAFADGRDAVGNLMEHVQPDGGGIG